MHRHLRQLPVRPFSLTLRPFNGTKASSKSCDPFMSTVTNLDVAALD